MVWSVLGLVILLCEISAQADLFAAPEDIALTCGYELKSHGLTTDDGYKLRIFRVQNKSDNFKRQPVLIHHGLIGSAVDFMLTANNSLAFFLARSGYDVWLANHRGNTYSRGHRHLKMSDPKFWDFSFHEIALYDIPSVVEYIAGETGNFTRIIYMGHSMGTSIAFIYCSVLADHCEQYLKGILALAPVALLGMKHSPLFGFFPSIYKVVQQLKETNIVVVFPDPKLLQMQLVRLCSQFPVVCLTVLNLIGGQDEGEFIPQLLPLLVSKEPNRTSLKCLAHYLQIHISGRFQHYDYNNNINFDLYNSTTPPRYDLDNIKIPVHLFYGLNDNLVEVEDVVWLYNELKSVKSINLVPENGDVRYTHFNFIVSKNIVRYLYKPLMRRMRELELVGNDL